MIWFWLFIGLLLLSFLYFAFVRSKPRHILVGLALALAIFAIFGSLYLLFTGKLQWIWLTSAGLVPWISRWFYLRRLLSLWQQRAVSKISSEHLAVTISQRKNQTITDGIILKDIPLKSASRIPSGISLSAIDENSLEQLQSYLQEHDAKAFHLLVFYGQTSGRFQIFDDPPANDTDKMAGKMNRVQALEVLGLSAKNCDDELIIKTHRHLIRQLHPDKGGSAYLASIINEARDVLLKK